MKLEKRALISCVVSLLLGLGWQVNAQIYDTNNDSVQTFAGYGEQGYLDGQGQLTKFSNPSQIVADSAGNLYVWDSGNYLIRKITPAGAVSTLAGGGLFVEGQGTNVSFSFYGAVGTMAIDRQNTIWLVTANSSYYNSSAYLLKITTEGYVTMANGGPGLTNLSTASGICFDSANNLYYSGGNRIWRYTPATGALQPFAGNGASGYVDAGGTIFPEFNSPAALACDQADDIYVWDSGNYRLRKIDPSQNVTTIAGNGSSYYIQDGNGTNATFNYYYYGNSTLSLYCDNNGNIYFAGGDSIRKMDAAFNVITMAGSFNEYGYANGLTNAARFNGASGVCLAQGSLFVADSGNQRIRQITFNTPPQIVSNANLSIATYPGVTITGAVGRTYQIQSSADLNTWTPVATVLLTGSPFLWIDVNAARDKGFYRALMLP